MQPLCDGEEVTNESGPVIGSKAPGISVRSGDGIAGRSGCRHQQEIMLPVEDTRFVDTS